MGKTSSAIGEIQGIKGDRVVSSVGRVCPAHFSLKRNIIQFYAHLLLLCLNIYIISIIYKGYHCKKRH